MGVFVDFENIANDFKVLLLEYDETKNNSLFKKIKLFFNNSNNIVRKKFDELLFERNTFDIIICGIHNFNCESINILSKIKEIDSDQNIIILNKDINTKTIITLLNKGINQFINLPLNDIEFKNKLYKNCEYVFYKKYYEKNESINIPLNVKNLIQKKSMDSNEFKKYLYQNNISKTKFENITKNLLDLSNQLNKCIEKTYIFKFNQAILENMIEILSEIIKQFNFIDSLKEISSVLENLMLFLCEIKIEYLNNTQLNTLRVLEFIFDDITRYINNVFIYRDTVD